MKYTYSDCGKLYDRKYKRCCDQNMTTPGISDIPLGPDHTSPEQEQSPFDGLQLPGLDNGGLALSLGVPRSESELETDAETPDG